MAAALEACRFNDFGESLRLRELTNGFDQIAISLAIVRHRAPKRWNDIEGIEFIEGIETGDVDGREFEAEETRSWLQYAISFCERCGDTWNVADAEGNRVGVKALVRKRQGLGITFNEGHLRVATALHRALAANLQHLCIDVAHSRPRARAAFSDHAKGDVSGAAGDIEERKRPIAFRRVYRRDEHLLPSPMEATGHQVVHEVVAPRHALEHVVDQRLLFLDRYLTEAEMGVGLA